MATVRELSMVPVRCIARVANRSPSGSLTDGRHLRPGGARNRARLARAGHVRNCIQTNAVCTPAAGGIKAVQVLRLGVVRRPPGGFILSACIEDGCLMKSTIYLYLRGIIDLYLFTIIYFYSHGIINL